MKNEHQNHLEVGIRPWGKYEVLHLEPGFKVKRVEVNPSSRLSLQKHEKREEIWTVVSGEGIAIVDDREIKIKEGSTVHVPLGAKHRIGNTGKTLLIFVEVQLGDYVGEDDIVRFEDDYHRS
ncbi:MAG: phosphomannose isomerase type II C-terminal cupin domain [Candidatus Omnitrophica bacterium]|nr:phosphomannose isomerase type II C-terminal cupin domain [Candidatus Omnitrophota bacterium]